jgi:hypothetical protein
MLLTIGESTLKKSMIMAVIDLRYKKEWVILIGIACQNRALAHGTYKFLLNGLLDPAGN